MSDYKLEGITIVIPTLGKLENLARLVKSIERQSFTKSNYEILIVVNGVIKNDLREKLLYLTSAYSKIVLKIYFITAKGVNRARNYGLNNAKYRIVLFLDDDCEMQNHHFLSQNIELHNQYKDCFAIGGGYLLANDSRYLDEIYNYVQMKWYFSGQIDLVDQTTVDESAGKETRYLLGGNFSIKSEIAGRQQLLFDESIIYGGSEYEFFKRARAMDLKMYATELNVVHHTQETLWSLTGKIYKQGRGKAHIEYKYGPTTRAMNKMDKRELDFFDIQTRLVKLYFRYIFWLGYYFYQKKYFTIIFHLVGDLINKLNFYRLEILKKIWQQLERKKNRGDRF